MKHFFPAGGNRKGKKERVGRALSCLLCNNDEEDAIRQKNAVHDDVKGSAWYKNRRAMRDGHVNLSFRRSTGYRMAGTIEVQGP